MSLTQRRLMRLSWAAACALCAVGGCGPALAAGGHVFSGSEHYAVDTWQVENGLPDNRISDVAQTTDGYLWIGTHNGLARFDGLRFTVFDERTPGLESGRIATLFADSAGGLWVGTDNGGLARHVEGRFTRFGPEHGWQSNTTACFAEDRGGIFIGTRGGGVWRYENHRFVELLDSDPRLPERVNLALDSASGATLWARTAEGVKCFRAGAWAARPLAGIADPSEISAVAPAREGGVWVCAQGRLQRLRDDAPPVLRGPVPRKPGAAIVSLTEDAAGQVWVATWGRGLLRLAPDGSSRMFTQDDGVPAILRCVFEDREGNVWVGTNGDGLLRLKPPVFRSYSPAPPLAAYRCNALAENPAGGLWIATDAHGLVQWRDNQFSAPIPLAKRGAERVTLALAVEPAGPLWIGSYYEGLFVRDGDASYNRTTNHGLPHNRVHAFAVARDGTVWIGSADGVSRHVGGRFENFGTADGLPAGAVRAVAPGAAGDVWFGFNSTGLARWHDGRFEKFDRENGLAHMALRCLHSDADGTLWIGTAGGGLIRWRDGRFFNFRIEDGVSQNKILAILDDELGHLWLGTGNGVLRVARANLEAFARGEVPRVEGTWYLKGDGLASVQCSEGSPSAVRTSDGRLWFATLKGLSVVNPRELRTNSVPPPVLIENVLIDGRPADRLAARSPLNVPAGSRRVEVHYAGLSFTAPERVRFRQRLEGLDDEWQDVGGQRVATFQGLRPGSYRFRVIAANNDGVWNEEGATLAFVMQPELWQTAWFRATVAVTLAGAVFGLVRIRIARLQRQQVAQREFSRGLIASQEAERKRIAAELHDSLGQNLLVIKNRVTMAKSAGADPVAELDEISKLAAQSLEEVREISQNLRPYQLDRLGLTRALHGLVKKVGASSKLNCVADITPLDRAFSSEAETNLFRIVQEALNNVLKHSGATEARVTIGRDESRVRLCIEDNGRGFEWPPKPGEAAPGMGLNGIAERVRILNGKLEIDSTPGQGTRLNIEAPIPGGNA